MPFKFSRLEMGVILVDPDVFADERGFFMETYKESDFKRAGIDSTFSQDNHSFSKKGVIRGLHFQRAPMSQGKLVRVISGRVWDVAVDVRMDSPTFRKCLSIELSSENNRMLYIPAGFAHGFLALSDDVHLMYKCTMEYDPRFDAGVRWDDPDIGISWPISKPIVSKKDTNLPLLRDAML